MRRPVFWAEQKGYVGSGVRSRSNTYVFGAPAPMGGWRKPSDRGRAWGSAGFAKRRRRACRPTERAGNSCSNRTEEDEVLDDGDVGAMLAALDVGARRLGRPATYVGHYRRRLICIACVNTLTKHRYCVDWPTNADQSGASGCCNSSSIEYIWRRAPLGGPSAVRRSTTTWRSLDGPGRYLRRGRAGIVAQPRDEVRMAAAHRDRPEGERMGAMRPRRTPGMVTAADERSAGFSGLLGITEAQERDAGRAERPSGTTF